MTKTTFINMLSNFFWNTKTGLLLSLFLIFLLFASAENFQYISFAKNKISNVEYDIRSDDSDKSAPFVFQVPQKHAKHSLKSYRKKYKNKFIFVKYPIAIKMSMGFECYSLRDWQNLFQTAPLSDGIRMELNKGGGGAILFGMVEHNGIDNFSGYTFPNAFIAGEKNHMELSISKEGLIELTVNGNILPKGFLEEPFEMSLIKAGTGWGNERYFDGKIENFSFEYTCYRKTVWLLWLIRILLAFAAFAIINRFIYRWNLK